MDPREAATLPPVPAHSADRRSRTVHVVRTSAV